MGTRVVLAAAWVLGFAAMAAVFFGHGPLEPDGHRGPALTGDGRYYYATVTSVLLDGDLDFANQYADQGNYYGFRQTRSGRPNNPFGFGASPLWAPTFLGARTLPGAATPAAMSPLEVRFALTGTLLVTALGLVALCRLLSRWFAPPASLAATWAAFGLTPWVWYALWEPAYPHAAGAALAAIFLLAVERVRERPGSRGRWLASGAALGALALVRPQEIVFALWYLRALAAVGRTDRRRALAGAALAAVAALALVAPQLVYWKALYGRFLMVPQGRGFMRWGESAWVDVLLSPRHGLAPWSPVVVPALAGLTLAPRGMRLPALLAVAVTGASAYMNGAAWDWWAGGSFGARRMTSVAPVLALGLACWSRFARTRFRVGAAVVGIAACALLAASQAMMVVAFARERIPLDAPMPAAKLYARAWRVSLSAPFARALDCALTFPASVAFARRHGVPCDRFAALSGRYVLDERVPSTNPMRRSIRSASVRLGDRASRGRGFSADGRIAGAAEVLVPLNRTGALELVVHGSAAPLDVAWNGTPVGRGPGPLRVPAAAIRRGVNVVRLAGPPEMPAALELRELSDWPPRWAWEHQIGKAVMKRR